MDLFYKSKEPGRSHSSFCKSCARQSTRNRVARLSQLDPRRFIGQFKTCKCCSVSKPVMDFYSKLTSPLGVDCICKICSKKRDKTRRNPETNRRGRVKWIEKTLKKDPSLFLWFRTKWAASAKGLDFDLDPEDLKIPEFCEVLGLRIVVKMPETGGRRGAKDEAASVDRLNSSLGYVKGNVRIISNLANTIKNFGTARQHELVAAYMRKHGID